MLSSRKSLCPPAVVAYGILCFFLTPLNQVLAATGNTAANISNNGLAVAREGIIYYIDHVGGIYAGSGEKIFTTESAGMPPALLSDDEAWDLNICGDWLYYSNWSDQHRIYKMRTNGTEKTKIGDDPANNVTIADDWAIYIKWTNTTGGRDNNIYKISLTAGGQPPIRLNNDESENLNVADGWIYYSNISDGHKLYKIKFDGTGRTKITDDPVLFMVEANGWLYYGNLADGGKLYKVAGDGAGRRKLSDDKAGFINVYAGYVYYTNASDLHALYRMKTDGTGRRRFCRMGVVPMPVNVGSGFVYYNHLLIKTE